MRIAILALALAGFGRAAFAEDIVPPFGFAWKSSPQTVEKTLKLAKTARIVDRKPKGEMEVWKVEGLVHPGLTQTLLTFRSNQLVGVELQYVFPHATIEKYNEGMGTWRRHFESKFGTGKLISRSTDTGTDVIQTLVGYQWIATAGRIAGPQATQPGQAIIELFYFSAQRDRNFVQTISVDYKLL